MKKQTVIFDHDGGVDDLLSLALLLTMDHIQLLGVTITPADCYPQDALTSTLKLLKLFARDDVPVAVGDYYGVNAFPHEWRAQPKICNAFPMMLSVEEDRSLCVAESAQQFIAECLKNHEDVTVLMTGPCSNLVQALAVSPELVQRVKEVIWMGGAVDVRGNVAMHNHDGTAEWNVFWDPVATKTLFESGLTIKLVALDATNALPVNIDFLQQLATNRGYALSDLAGQFWAVTINSIPSYEYTYYMWDILATSVLGVPEHMVTFEPVTLNVAVNPPNAGQTFRDDNHGYPVLLATAVDREGVLAYVSDQFARNF